MTELVTAAILLCVAPNNCSTQMLTAQVPKDLCGQWVRDEYTLSIPPTGIAVRQTYSAGSVKVACQNY
jgi:hypothetical protein